MNWGTELNWISIQSRMLVEGCGREIFQIVQGQTDIRIYRAAAKTKVCISF